MRRHPALQDLSRDHFTALNHVVQAERIVEGGRFARPLAEVWGEWQSFWDKELQLHFQAEEEQLLPHLEQPDRRPFADRLRREHGDLRSAMGVLAGEPDRDALWAAARALRAHVRWEENELFEHLQTWLSEEALQKLWRQGTRFREAHDLPVGPASGS